MAQVLLKNNRRASLVLAILSTLPIGAGAALLFWSARQSGAAFSIIAIFGGSILLGGIVLLGRQLWWTYLPRISCEQKDLLVYMNGIKPIQVPLNVVECFFLGEGPSMISMSSHQEVNSVTVVVRLAERATDWHQRAVSESLGKWCDGYITIRGTWTEPLTREVVTQMNSALAAIKRAEKMKTT